MGLLQNLKPRWWFSAHLHARYEATYNHTSPGAPVEVSQPSAHPPQPVQNPDEIVIDDDEFDNVEPAPPPTQEASPTTKTENEVGKINDEALSAPPPVITSFLALDKCLPQRQFLEVIDVDAPAPHDTAVLSFDPEWLAINRAFHPWFSTARFQRPFPEEAEARTMIAKELEWVEKNVKKNDEGLILIDEWQTFAQTAPGPGSEGADKFKQRKIITTCPRRDMKLTPLRCAAPLYPNPQTAAFCKMLNIADKIV